MQRIVHEINDESDKKLNMADLGFGTQVPTAEPDWSAAQNHDAATIPASGTKRIHWKINLSGLLNTHRWLPLFALSGQGLSISCFLAPVNDSLIASHSGTTYSQSYQLRNVKALCSMMLLSDELQESYNSMLLSGTALRIPIKKLESLWSYIPNGVPSKFDVPMSRAYTRLCSLYASFVQEPPADGSGKAKLCNSFYVHPGSSETLAYNLQLGSAKSLDNDAVGFSEHWWRLLNCVGISGSLAHSTGITLADYSSNSYSIAVDTEKIAHLASSGTNLSNTSTIFLKIAGFGTTAAHLPSRCHLIAQYDSVLEIRDTTVELFE